MVGRPLNGAALRRIEHAIGEAEKTSRAELVAMIAPRAGRYLATSLIVSILGTLGAGAAFWWCMPWASGMDVLLVQLVVLPVLLIFLELTPLGDWLTPGGVKAEAAQRLARAAFLEHGLATTPERNAVLFFVSMAEHHVEIIADGEIHQRAGSAAWQKVVDEFAASVRRGDVEGGFIGAIEALEKLLAQHYPAIGSPPNVVANRLILLD